jgi:DSF synthase
MGAKLTYRPREPDAFPNWRFANLDVDYEPRSQSLWMYYKADGPPFYTFQTLSDMADIRESVRALFRTDVTARYPIRYFVMASRKPGVFNLGGDLAMFSQAIKGRERAWLRDYAHACIDVVYGLATAFGLPIVTLSVVTGQALGGGLEAALAEDFLLAEENAKLGVPEVAFNTFPGMGAMSLLSRRIGMLRAEVIMTTGAVYTGREMYDLGVVDLLALDGSGHHDALNWMTDGGEVRHARRLALANARRLCFPVSYDELIRITDLWADISCDVEPNDIRHMERLVAAQKRLTAPRIFQQ